MGHPNESCRLCHKKKDNTYDHRLVWKKCCRECPQRAECVGKSGERLVETRIDYPLLHERRQIQKTPAFKQAMQQRNGIEGTLSELVRALGLRRTRYRGLRKTRLCHLMIAAACNAKRWLRRLAWEVQQSATPAVA